MEINLSQPSTWDMAEENTGGKKNPYFEDSNQHIS